MIYSLLLLLLFSALLLILGRRDRYAYLFVVMTLGAALAFFSIILHINMFGNYYFYQRSALFKLDYIIFRWVVNTFRISIVTNLRIMNVGLALYLLVMPLFSLDLLRWDEPSPNAGKKKLWAIWWCLAPPLVLCLFDPSVSTAMYLRYQRADQLVNIYRLYKAAEILSKAVVLAQVMGPMTHLLRCWRRMTVRFFRRKIALFSLCLALFNLLFYSFFFLSPFSVSADKVCRSGFWIFENIQFRSYAIYVGFPVVVFALSAICMAILLSFQMDASMTVFFERRIRTNIRAMNETFSEVMHSQKNLLFALRILARKTEKACPEAAGCEPFQRLDSLIDTSLQHTAQMLDSLQEIRLTYLRNDLLTIVDSAVRETTVPETIRMCWTPDSYREVNWKGMYDKYHLKRALQNVLNNAVEAVIRSGKPDGRITVELVRVFRWMAIVVTDNGIGIDRRNRRKIFEPHFSAKRGLMNWGMGLTYTYKVLKAHLGQVKIDSAMGKYTSVLLLLPQRKGMNV